MISYDLHKIGWKQFEDLCITVLHKVFGRTVTPYAMGRDGGQDAFFNSALSDSIVFSSEQKIINDFTKGKVVFQFKHTSKERDMFKYITIHDEINKLNSMVNEDSIDYYIILTNYSVSGETISGIKKRIRSEVSGLKDCEILGKEWFDNIINENSELQRIIPRIYGIGDLAQVLDERVISQSSELLKYWRNNINTFVPTSTYSKAIDSLKKNNFIMITGSPQSGKTVIAQNLCLSILQEDNEYIALSLNIEDFNKHYNPNDKKRIYLFNDVFGEQSVYELRTQQLNEQLFTKLDIAIEDGAYVICTCRDYIFNQLTDNGKIKRSTRTFERIIDRNTAINISNDSYTLEEKNKILYRHIKHGNLPKEIKTRMKPFLNQIAIKDEFTPELARRLADYSYSKNVTFTFDGVSNFFEKPIEYLRSVFSELEESEKAGLLLILLKKGQLPVSIGEKDLDERITNVYDIKSSDITKALKHMKNSLVLQDRIGNKKIWKPYHPSMKEALVQYLKEREEMIEIFISLADFKTLVNETSLIDSENKIFVSEDQWELLSKRLFSSLPEVVYSRFLSFEDSYLFKREELIRYFLNEVNEDYFFWFDKAFTDSQEVWEKLTTESIYEQLHSVSTFDFAYKLFNLGLLTTETIQKISERILNIGRKNFDVSFLVDEHIRAILVKADLDKLVEHYILYGVEMGQQELDVLIDNFHEGTDDIEGELENYLCHWFESIEILKQELQNRGELSDELLIGFDNLFSDAESWKEQQIEECEENEFEEADRSFELVEMISNYFVKIKGIDDDNISEIVNEMISEITKDYTYDRIETIRILKELVASCIENSKENYLFILNNILSQVTKNYGDIYSDVDE